jgi:hypothetical protein
MSAPFCWQAKAALRMIREKCPEPASALGVYLALSVADSDAGGTGQFVTTHKWLASLSGLSTRTIWARLRDLQAVGLISVTTPALKAPSTFRLLPFGNNCGTSRNGCRAFRNGEAPPLRTSEEKKETKPPTPIQAPETVDTPAPLSWRKKFAEELLKD